MGALATAVQQGKALYAGISSYSPSRTRRAAAILADIGVPLLIHQPSYSMLNRWIEDELLDTLDDLGVGCIGFSPLAQGMLTERYLDGIPDGSRASREDSLDRAWLTDSYVESVRALKEIAQARGQTVAQMAVAWTLRDPRVTTTLIGASSVEQFLDTVGAVANLDFTAEELQAIDTYTRRGGHQHLGATVTAAVSRRQESVAVQLQRCSRRPGHASRVASSRVSDGT